MKLKVYSSFFTGAAAKSQSHGLEGVASLLVHNKISESSRKARVLILATTPDATAAEKMSVVTLARCAAENNVSLVKKLLPASHFFRAHVEVRDEVCLKDAAAFSVEHDGICFARC